MQNYLNKNYANIRKKNAALWSGPVEVSASLRGKLLLSWKYFFKKLNVVKMWFQVVNIKIFSTCELNSYKNSAHYSEHLSHNFSSSKNHLFNNFSTFFTIFQHNSYKIKHTFRHHLYINSAFQIFSRVFKEFQHIGKRENFNGFSWTFNLK